MSNGINKPGEDIKKYDSSFLQEKKNPIVLRETLALKIMLKMLLALVFLVKNLLCNKSMIKSKNVSLK